MPRNSRPVLREAACQDTREGQDQMSEDLRTAVAIPRTLVALGVGLLTFVVLSSLRIRVQYLAPQPPAVGLLLTLLVYLVSGFATGVLLTRAYLLTGSVLGLFTVTVVWFEVPLRSGRLALADLATALVAFALFGVIACTAGCAAAGFVRARRARATR
jgi:hypothetical protein